MVANPYGNLLHWDLEAQGLPQIAFISRVLLLRSATGKGPSTVPMVFGLPPGKILLYSLPGDHSSREVMVSSEDFRLMAVDTWRNQLFRRPLERESA